MTPPRYVSGARQGRRHSCLVEGVTNRRAHDSPHRFALPTAPAHCGCPLEWSYRSAPWAPGADQTGNAPLNLP
jgi:hypothetical protein